MEEIRVIHRFSSSPSTFLCVIAILMFGSTDVDGKPEQNNASTQDILLFDDVGTDNNSVIDLGHESTDISTSDVVLSISAKNLSNQNTEVNPICIVYEQRPGSSTWEEYRTTETAWGNPNPNFDTKIVIPFQFGEKQLLKLEICDYSMFGANWKENSLGYTIVSLGQIVYAGRGKLQLELTKTANYAPAQNVDGSIINISVTEVPSSNEQVVLQLSGSIPVRWYNRVFKHSNLFIEIFKADEQNNDYISVHKSEEIRATSTPAWKQFVIPTQTLYDGNVNKRIKFACQAASPKGELKRIGEFETTIEELLSATKREFPLTRSESKKKTAYGSLTVDNIKIVKNKSFLDYIMGGARIQTVLAIDFSIKNGIRERNCLHKVDLSDTSFKVLNTYEQAISSIFTIMEDYSAKKHFPTYGFAMEVPPRHISNSQSKFAQVFNLSLDRENDVCVGVEGILKAYRKSASEAGFHSKLEISSILDQFMEHIQHSQSSFYNILVILTTGEISREKGNTTRLLDDAMKKILTLSYKPASIIIVGMGDYDFKDLKVFDANANPMVRDIVQFVPFKAFSSQDSTTGKSQLAKEALAGVPQQLVLYMLQNNFDPAKHPFADLVDLPEKS